MSLVYLPLDEKEVEALERVFLLFLEESYNPFDIELVNGISRALSQQKSVRDKIAADREIAFRGKMSGADM